MKNYRKEGAALNFRRSVEDQFNRFFDHFFSEIIVLEVLASSFGDFELTVCYK